MSRETKKEICYDILKKDWLTVNAVVGIAVLITFFLMILQRLDVIPNMPCAVHDLLHVYCPGCGGTRAIFALLQGQILTSLYYNPAIVLGVLLALYYEIGVFMTLVKKNGKPYFCTNLTFVVIYLLIVGIFAIVRNYLLIAQGIDMLEDFIPFGADVHSNLSFIFCTYAA